jgi:hypothetical protein
MIEKIMMTQEAQRVHPSAPEEEKLSPGRHVRRRPRGSAPAVAVDARVESAINLASGSVVNRAGMQDVFKSLGIGLYHIEVTTQSDTS